MATHTHKIYCSRLNVHSEHRENTTEAALCVFLPFLYTEMSLYLFLLQFNPHILGCRGGTSVKKVLVELQIEM